MRIINGDETPIGSEGSYTGRAKCIVSTLMAVTGGSINKTDGKAHVTANLAMSFPEYERPALVVDGAELVPEIAAAPGKLLPWQVRACAKLCVQTVSFANIGVAGHQSTNWL